jgi:hypothetical protein
MVKYVNRIDIPAPLFNLATLAVQFERAAPDDHQHNVIAVGNYPQERRNEAILARLA